MERSPIISNGMTLMLKGTWYTTPTVSICVDKQREKELPKTDDSSLDFSTDIYARMSQAEDKKSFWNIISARLKFVSTAPKVIVFISFWSVAPTKWQ